MWPFRKRPKAHVQPVRDPHAARRHSKITVCGRVRTIHDVFPWTDGPMPVILDFILKKKDGAGLSAYIADPANLERDMASIIKAGLCVPSIPADVVMRNQREARPLFLAIIAHSLNKARGFGEAYSEQQCYELFRWMFNEIWAVHNTLAGEGNRGE